MPLADSGLPQSLASISTPKTFSWREAYTSCPSLADTLPHSPLGPTKPVKGHIILTSRGMKKLSEADAVCPGTRSLACATAGAWRYGWDLDVVDVRQNGLINLA